MSDFDKRIGTIGPKRHRVAVMQLVNVERRERNLPSLRTAPSLVVSSRAWARSLSRRTAFDHGTGSLSFGARAARFPFRLNSRLRRNVRLGENIAFGVGPLGTPREIVRRWMASASHRANILGSWKYTGVWTTPDNPRKPGRQSDAVTVVQHFGAR